jgi:hypothetical protein
MKAEPYFLTNKEWYTEKTNKDGITISYSLTEEGKKNTKVARSFNEYQTHQRASETPDKNGTLTFY